ncbi:MAG: 2-oxoacid:acceptor oxidoreductase subunit alpha [Thermoflexales bacterium]|nr:2-oxoacid:acceptor oxidoreductase subunit alpha [Thermoflexales bacterium]
MSTAEPLVAPAPAERPPVVNDFSIIVGTKNGSGSQTANATILRALFKMGLPVSGKNLFPSNIQGLPTWYTVRVSADGWIARRETAEITVAMNPATMADDLARTAAGGIYLYPDDAKVQLSRTDITYYPMPVKKLSAASDVDAKLKGYIANMVYVGVLAWLLGIDRADIEAALAWQFRNKAKAVATNMAVVNAAHEWAGANLTKADPFRVERLPESKTAGLIMIDGNTAGALGSVYGGVTFVAWYPITPATSLADGLHDYLPRLRGDAETGKPTYAVVQTEDELAALGMVLGAGWAGARAMTSTSGPGISLMSEFAGLGYFAEIPAVIWDVTRMGPSTGLPTRVSQGDLLKLYLLGHGDTRQVVLMPGDVAECFEFGWRAFDLAERLQTPIFVASDLDLGMNQWMSKPFEYPDQPMDRGKVLTAADLERLGGFARYKDVDGDGIGYRTLPGTEHPLAAYFTRGTGHNERAGYSEKPEDWTRNLERLDRKHDTARKLCPQPVVEQVEGAEIGLVAFGSVTAAVEEARAMLAREGIKASLLRPRALPLAEGVRDFIAAHKRTYVIEMSQHHQLCDIIRLEMPELAGRVLPLNLCDGLPVTAKWVSENLLARETK